MKQFNILLRNEIYNSILRMKEIIDVIDISISDKAFLESLKKLKNEQWRIDKFIDIVDYELDRDEELLSSTINSAVQNAPSVSVSVRSTKIENLPEAKDNF